MNSSTSQRSKGVILDTNVLSLFAKIDRLDLLDSLASSAREEIKLYITPALQDELEVGIERGIEYLKDVIMLVKVGKLHILALNHADKLLIESLPTKLNLGEAEAIALCSRLSLAFITHDGKAFNYCKRMGIACTRLTTLLDSLKAVNVLTEAEIDEMLS